MEPTETAMARAEVETPMLKRFTPILILVGLCWAVFVINNVLLGGRLNEHGIYPRHAEGLSGIIWAPFLHVSYQHLAANTVPLLLLGGILCGRSRREFWLVTLAGILLSGGLTWVFARNACHIGASGLIFCFFGYLASMALFRRTFGTLILSAVCVLAYGGILRGLLPTSAAISWEGHLSGFLAGIGLAWLASKLNPPHRTSEAKPTDAVLTRG
jgi:membrane associated rhomboid family serine protease